MTQQNLLNMLFITLLPNDLVICALKTDSYLFEIIL